MGNRNVKQNSLLGKLTRIEHAFRIVFLCVIGIFILYFTYSIITNNGKNDEKIILFIYQRNIFYLLWFVYVGLAIGISVIFLINKKITKLVKLFGYSLLLVLLITFSYALANVLADGFFVILFLTSRLFS